MDLTLIPAETLLTLRTSARTQTVERGLPGIMFDQAERMVERGHVCLDKPKAGWVYDLGSWRNVSLKYCAHCGSGGACVHQVAIMFAALLAEHCPQPEQTTEATCGGYSGGGIPGRSGRRSGGGYGGGRRAGGGKRGTCRDCTHCRWHTDTGCNNPNRRAGRNWRA